MIEVSALLRWLGPAMPIALGLIAGGLLGLGHFGSLWWNARLYARGGAGRALAIHLARLALLILALTGLAKLGAVVLLSGALGLLLARTALVRRLGTA